MRLTKTSKKPPLLLSWVLGGAAVWYVGAVENVSGFVVFLAESQRRQQGTSGSWRARGFSC